MCVLLEVLKKHLQSPTIVVHDYGKVKDLHYITVQIQHGVVADLYKFECVLYSRVVKHMRLYFSEKCSGKTFW